MKRVWRYSHLGIAIVSSLFLLVTAITGVILAIEPINTKAQGFYDRSVETVKLGDLIEILRADYEEVMELKVDENNFVKASIFDTEKDLDGDFYIVPQTGKIIGKVEPKRDLFEFAKSLHRSLFLKKTGRIIVGINAFFLFLMALSGILLLFSRQKGWRHALKKLEKSNFSQFAHVFLGRWMLLPLVVVSLSGVGLTMIKFKVFGEEIPQTQTMEIKESESKKVSDFPVFDIPVKKIKALEFPFSTDAEDYYILKLQDKTLSVSQINGQIVEQEQSTKIQQGEDVFLFLHTGKGSFLWAFVLLCSGLSILYFIYSGVQIFLKRKTTRIKNKYKPEEAEVIVLFGSENGSTRRFSKVFYKALIQANQKAFITELNDYNRFPNMANLVLITSTYGDGEAPGNAQKFLQKLKKDPPLREFKFSVVGFGSVHYKKYCAYALKLDKILGELTKSNREIAVASINNQNYTDFRNWGLQWGKKQGVNLEFPVKMKTNKSRYKSYKVIENSSLQDGYTTTFRLRLRAPNDKFRSGDLLGVFPPKAAQERFYSIAKVGRKEILLSVKKHDQGLCSGYLYSLEKGSKIRAYTKHNPSFYPPSSATSLTLIANGTGIAPFLGMMDKDTKVDKYLYWGVQGKKSIELYKERIENSQKTGNLKVVKYAFSREESEEKHLQDWAKKEGELWLERLEKGGFLMICGSVDMKNDLLKILEKKAVESNRSLSQYKQQILEDCY